MGAGAPRTAVVQQSYRGEAASVLTEIRWLARAGCSPRQGRRSVRHGRRGRLSYSALPQRQSPQPPPEPAGVAPLLGRDRGRGHECRLSPSLPGPSVASAICRRSRSMARRFSTVRTSSRVWAASCPFASRRRARNGSRRGWPRRGRWPPRSRRVSTKWASRAASGVLSALAPVSRRAELKPMVAQAAFTIPSTAAVRWRSRPSSARVGGARLGRTAVAASGTIARGG